MYFLPLVSILPSIIPGYFGTSCELLGRADGSLVQLPTTLQRCQCGTSRVRNQGSEGSQSWLVAQRSLLKFHSRTLLDVSFAPWFYTQLSSFVNLSIFLCLSDTHTQTHKQRNRKKNFSWKLLDGSVIPPTWEWGKVIRNTQTYFMSST